MHIVSTYILLIWRTSCFIPAYLGILLFISFLIFYYYYLFIYLFVYLFIIIMIIIFLEREERKKIIWIEPPTLPTYHVWPMNQILRSSRKILLYIYIYIYIYAHKVTKNKSFSFIFKYF